jgi:hypothetical protein
MLNDTRKLMVATFLLLGLLYVDTNTPRAVPEAESIGSYSAGCSAALLLSPGGPFLALTTKPSNLFNRIRIAPHNIGRISSTQVRPLLAPSGHAPHHAAVTQILRPLISAC